MRVTKVIYDQIREVFMTNVCSKCGFPMITTVKIMVESQKQVGFSFSKAENIVIETSSNAIEEVVKFINSCYETKRPLDGKQDGSGTIEFGRFCYYSYIGYDSPCPICSNIDPWKKGKEYEKPWKIEEYKREITPLTKNNFPTIFTDLNEVEKWIYDRIQEINEKIDQKRLDDSAVKGAIDFVKKAKVRIKVLKSKLDSISEIHDRNKLKSELMNINELKCQLGILDINRRIAVNKKIRKLKIKIAELNDIISKKEPHISQEIAELEDELLIKQAIAFGCSGKYFHKECNNVLSYLPIPNPVPNYIMDEIENSEICSAKSGLPLHQSDLIDSNPLNII